MFSARPRQPGILLPPLLGALTIIALSGCQQQSNAIHTPVISVPLTVPVEKIITRPWQQTIEGFGRLVAAEKVAISVETAGTIRAIHFREGQRVESGQVLLELDDRKARLRLKRAGAEVDSARAGLEQTRSTFQRYQKLSARQVVAEETFQQTEATYRAASARLNRAIAARELARQELRDRTFISPASGTVESEAIEPGQRVRPGETLAVLQSDQPLQVITYVREEEVNLLRVGEAAPVQSPGAPGRTFQSRIESIASAADAKTGNFAVKLRVDDNDSALRSGMSARVTLRSATAPEVVAIPRSALIDRQRRRVAFVVENGLAREVEPVLGLGDNQFVTVRAGLNPGDYLITGRLRLIGDQTPVQPLADGDVAVVIKP